MGYALFTARKLMLQNRLNQMNYRLMMLTQQQQDLASQSASIEMMNGFRSSMNSIFSYDQQKTAYDKLLTNPPADSNAMNIELGKLQASAGREEEANKIRSAADMTKLKSIQAIDNQIDLEMKKIDTQVKATTAEMESVEKAEDTAIKAAAPKYGGGAGG